MMIDILGNVLVAPELEKTDGRFQVTHSMWTRLVGRQGIFPGRSELLFLRTPAHVVWLPIVGRGYT